MCTGYWKTRKLFRRRASTRSDLCQASSITRGWVEKELYRLLNHKLHLFWLPLDRGIQKFRAKEAACVCVCVCHFCPQSGPPSTTTAHNGAYHKLLKSSAHSYNTRTDPLRVLHAAVLMFPSSAFGSIFRSTVFTSTKPKIVIFDTIVLIMIS